MHLYTKTMSIKVQTIIWIIYATRAKIRYNITTYYYVYKKNTLESVETYKIKTKKHTFLNM